MGFVSSNICDRELELKIFLIGTVNICVFNICISLELNIIFLFLLIVFMKFISIFFSFLIMCFLNSFKLGEI